MTRTLNAFALWSGMVGPMEQGPVYEKAAYTNEKPVGQSRWIVRSAERILQQYWAITSYGASGRILGIHGEWRDVPTETE